MIDLRAGQAGETLQESAAMGGLLGQDEVSVAVEHLLEVVDA